jgi:hypothetical protein
MPAVEIADWSVLAAGSATLVTLFGVGLGKFFVLMHKVACLEAWAESVAVELVAQEQAHDVQLMRERMDRIENGMDKLATSDGKEVAWWQM